jgi:hypothetical protein
MNHIVVVLCAPGSTFGGRIDRLLLATLNSRCRPRAEARQRQLWSLPPMRPSVSGKALSRCGQLDDPAETTQPGRFAAGAENIPACLSTLARRLPFEERPGSRVRLQQHEVRPQHFSGRIFGHDPTARLERSEPGRMNRTGREQLVESRDIDCASVAAGSAFAESPGVVRLLHILAPGCRSRRKLPKCGSRRSKPKRPYKE